MKVIILLFMLVSVQAFSQAVQFYQKVNSVQLFTVEEFKNANNKSIYKFIDEKSVKPIKINDTTWQVRVPSNEFTMLLIDEKEWIGIKPNNYTYIANVFFVFDDNYMTVVEFDTTTMKYIDNFFQDLVSISK